MGSLGNHLLPQNLESGLGVETGAGESFQVGSLGGAREVSLGGAREGSLGRMREGSLGRVW